MHYYLKTKEEIEYMRISGRILARILFELKKIVAPGITTAKIDQHAENLMREYNVQPSFKGYRGYPAVTCISVNEEVVHSIPRERKLHEGDLVSIDCGVIYKGFHSDACIVTILEPVSSEIKKFIRTAEKALEAGISIAKPGNHVGDISYAIQHIIEAQGYSVVHEFTGHGIGRNLHEPPPVPNLGKKGSGPALIPGMTLALEPIFNMGNREVQILDDEWTAVTKDGSLSIQVEHTILITPVGNEILTLL